MPKLLLITLLLGCSTCLTLALSLPLEDAGVDGETVILDETTTVRYGIPATEIATEITTEIPTEILQNQEIKVVERLEDSVDECKTTRGLRGTCMTVKDCYPVLVKLESNSSTISPNPELAKILVNVSGFCTGSLEARSDITRTVFEQIMRSEVMLCCPSERGVQKPSNKITLDEPSNDVITDSESFRAKSCGYLKIDQSNLTVLNSTGDRILKGRKTDVGEFPWTVAMLNSGRQFCGASLINERTVLTAAHCVQHMSASDVKSLRLHIGDHTIYSNSETKHQVRGASKVLFHKGFSMKHLNHDIAIVHLDKPVAFSDTIQPVCLHSGSPPFDTGKVYADVTGWGALREGGDQPSDLRAVKVRVITKADCINRYKSQTQKVTNGMVCAGSDNGEDSCQGDSGGPLTIDSRNQAKIIGIVSWGIGCGRYPGVYTSVYHYASWIEKNQA